MKKLRLEGGKNQGNEQVPTESTPVYIAADISRSKWVYAVRWGGQERWRLTSDAELSQLKALVERYTSIGCPVSLAYEACGFGYEIAWWAEEQSLLRVVVVAPSTVERSPGLQVKTDRVDARKLAMKLEQGDLKGVHVPRRSQHEHRQYVRTYEQLIKDRKRLQVRIRSVLQEHGRIGPAPGHGWKKYERWLDAQELPACVSECVETLRRSREFVDARVQQMKLRILELGKHADYKTVVETLAEQGGVGPFSAVCFVLEIGDIRRFRTAGSLPRYLGLTPSEYSSGTLEHRGHILKCGPGKVRGLLLQCGWVSCRYDPGLKAVFERLAPRVGRKRAVVAVTRRLALRMRARWMAVLEAQLPEAA